MKKISSYLNAFLPPVIWAGIIYFLSAQQVLSGFEVSTYDFIFKKCAHMFVYAVLYVLLFRGTSIVFSKKSHTTKVWLPVFIAFIYALTDELHQSTVPGREATIRDVGYDMLGVAIAFLKMYRYI